MISKNRMKWVRSLELKKNRKEEELFVAEGPKTVGDMMAAFHCQYVAATKEWLYDNEHRLVGVDYDELTDDELRKLSFMEHPQQVLALFGIPKYGFTPEVPSKELCLALDQVQNPGNLGTIIRIADWFGIEHLICSQGSADAYNPKTVQAAMGSLARVKVHQLDLSQYLESIHTDIPIFGTFLDGDNIYETKLDTKGVIVMGNEGNGISDPVARHVTKKLYIPNYNLDADKADSLNVAVATAVTCAEFRRRKTTC